MKPIQSPIAPGDTVTISQRVFPQYIRGAECRVETVGERYAQVRIVSYKAKPPRDARFVPQKLIKIRKDLIEPTLSSEEIERQFNEIRTKLIAEARIQTEQNGD